MKKAATFILCLLCLPMLLYGRNVTVRAVDQPAATVFRSIVGQTGKNFVYPSELLHDMRISVTMTDAPLEKVLEAIFAGTDIEFHIKGSNIILKRRRKATKAAKKPLAPTHKPPTPLSVAAMSGTLEEVTVVSRLEAPVTETPMIGAKKLTAQEIISTPALFGESDVIKSLQMQPGISEGNEALAGMHVHGGNADENLYMLDNVPLYQVNHFAGLFSAFNAEAIRYVDFFKSSIPARYDGRLSSFLDVRTRNGSADGHHGSFRLGLTSGSL
ncbi:MAG: TonB-dependent receptor plug domain-containing protein, partial [Muribaculaceae bacterium]|nr:TonB-dependent receptor plug domain-containing protein [Muribaculaceae bacterium]